MTPEEETNERNACDEWFHEKGGASIQEAWVEATRRSMNWIELTSTGPRPNEGEQVFITGMGPFKRFYADAVYEGLTFMLWDSSEDEYLHPTDPVTHWARIKEPS